MRPVFVGGCPRSGTTLLGALLGAHSRAVCVPEVHFKLDLLHDLGWEEPVPVEQVARRLDRSWRYAVWGMSTSPQVLRAETTGGKGEGITYRQAMEGIVRAYATEVEQEHSEVWIDHTPGNVRHTRKLLDQFPDAKFIHLVRDGRAVTASVLPLDWGPNSVFEARSWWPTYLAHGLAAELRYPQRVIRISYEALLGRPHRVLVKLCEFLDLESEPHMGSVTNFRVPRFTRGQHVLVTRPPDPSRIDAWKTALSPRQIELLEASVGDLLESLDYPLVFGGRAAGASAWEALTDQLSGLLSRERNRVRRHLRIRRFARSGRVAEASRPADAEVVPKEGRA